MTDLRRTILLTGGSGQVGSQLLPLLRDLGPVAAPTREELDLGDVDGLRSHLRRLQPRWIVNLAAYTSVDQAEQESTTAFALNAIAPQVIGEEAARLGIPVLHFSTDYVFGHGGSGPRSEDDTTAPLNAYGASKLEGELRLAAAHADHLIFRTSWVYGARGRNFLRSILQSAREREEVRVVADQYGAPTWSQDLARMAFHAIARTDEVARKQGSSPAAALRPTAGIYHACNSGCTTWFGFAEEIVRLARLAEPKETFARLAPIASAEYPTLARRPANSRMNCEKLQRNLGFEMPAWQTSVASVMSELDVARQERSEGYSIG